MPRFLALYKGAASGSERQQLSAKAQRDFLAAWGAWAQAHKSALVDPGAPLSEKRLVTADGVETFRDAKTGYAIVEAQSHDDAVAIFAEHPHLRLMTGNAIEVLECPPVPGQSG